MNERYDSFIAEIGRMQTAVRSATSYLLVAVCTRVPLAIRRTVIAQEKVVFFYGKNL